MKRKGFTLIELLVVIAIIALLMSILMPALSRVNEMARRVVCGSNQTGIVKAMQTYSNQDETGRFPRGGKPNGEWGPVVATAWNTPPGYLTMAKAPITASLYLLVKRDYVTPKQMVCKSDTDAMEWAISKEPGYTANPIQYWQAFDFGETPADHVSYAFHMPYSFLDPTLRTEMLTSARDPGLAVVADRTPGAAAEDGLTNSNSHEGDGQQVAFLDTHVEFATKPACGVSEDNIYTQALGVSAPSRRTGKFPSPGMGPFDRWDSMLVNQ
jgi:prepilin-type N-terminal cleavage/methylation domain-containing protein